MWQLCYGQHTYALSAATWLCMPTCHALHTPGASAADAARTFCPAKKHLTPLLLLLLPLACR
jgi:hypothetical protein